MSIDVIICDDQTFMRAGIRSLLALESDMKVLGESATSGGALIQIARRTPHIVLGGGLDTAVGIASSLQERAAPSGRPGPGVVALLTHDEETSIVGALLAGVRGVVRKDGPTADLVAAIRAVAAGHASLTPKSTRCLVDWAVLASPPAANPSTACHALTRAETHVLRLIAGGMTSLEAAERLSVTEATIRSHVHHILAKLDLRSRSEAVAYAYRHGIVSPSRSGARSSVPTAVSNVETNETGLYTSLSCSCRPSAKVDALIPRQAGDGVARSGKTSQ
jgi:DNA-binding NarL/FixJ family response regulator